MPRWFVACVRVCVRARACVRVCVWTEAPISGMYEAPFLFLQICFLICSSCICHASLFSPFSGRSERYSGNLVHKESSAMREADRARGAEQERRGGGGGRWGGAAFVWHQHLGVSWTDMRLNMCTQLRAHSHKYCLRACWQEVNQM